MFIREMKRKKTKRLWQLFTCFILCVMFSVSVHADEPGMPKPDYATDYFMIVESPNGGINIYPGPSLSHEPLNSELIPNGTALHILGELTDDSKRVWGYTAYLGMNGYVPLDDCSPATEEEAIESELSLVGDDHRNYDADYDITVSAEDGTVVLRKGPAKKYNRVSGSGDIPGGTVLHMDEDVEMNDGSHWGHTEFGGLNGWVNLDGLKEWKEKYGSSADTLNTAAPESGNSGQNAGTADGQNTPSVSPQGGATIPGEGTTSESDDLIAASSGEIQMTPSASETVKAAATSTPKPVATATPKPTATSTPKPTATPTPKPTATPTPEPTATPTPEPTATPTPEPTATPTPEPTATSTPEPTMTPTPEPTETPTPEPTETPTPEPSETPTAEPTMTPTVEPTAASEAEDGETSGVTGAAASGQEASSQEVKSAESPLQNPLVWIGGLTILVIIILLIYHFVKSKKQ